MCHLIERDHRSYVISLPPLSAGAVHASVTVDLVTPFTSNGPRGFVGGPSTQTSQSAVSVPESFTKVSTYRPVSERTALVMTSFATLSV